MVAFFYVKSFSIFGGYYAVVLNKKNILLFLLSCVVLACTQNNTTPKSSDSTDSLTVWFEKANNDSISYAKRQFYTQKAFAVVSEQKNDSMKRIYYFKIANRYFNMNAMDDYKKSVRATIQLCEEAKDTLGLGKAYSYLGDYYGTKFVSDSAYIYYFKAEKLYKKINDNGKIAKTILNKSVLQLNEKDYIGSEKAAFDALKYLRKANDEELTYQAYNVLGVIYNELNEYDKSLEFHNKALTVVLNSKIPSELQYKAMSLNNIGAIYQYKDNHISAIKKFNEALNERNLYYGNPLLYAALLNNLGYSKFKLKENIGILNLFYKSLKISDSLKLIPNTIFCKLNLSEYYAYNKDTIKARSFAKEAYTLAKSNNLSKDVLLSLKQLAVVVPEKSAAFSLEYIRINDSLQIAERKIRNKLARIEFETEELAIEKDNLLEQQRTIIFIGLGVLFLFGLFYVIRFQAAKNRELILKQEQQKANEEVYQIMLRQQEKIEAVRQLEKKQIAKELHDGVLGKLFGTRMNLDSLNNYNDEKTIAERVVFIEELKSIEQEIREISHDFNKEKTAIFNNFVVMVMNFIQSQNSVCTAEIDFQMDDAIDWSTFSNITKINLYRILQESFQNINKYAKAKQVIVTFDKVESILKLNIQDNGVGFNYKRKRNGIGLTNMNSRIIESGGTMTITTEINKGTKLEFELPIP
jgi:signal transduction histidine kinase